MPMKRPEEVMIGLPGTKCIWNRNSWKGCHGFTVFGKAVILKCLVEP